MKQDSKGLNAIYRAIVVSNEDELEIGRIRVRVPFLHGTNNTANTSKCIPDDKLPYAYPCTLLSAQDSGMFLVPEVGTMVFIIFENGNQEKPLYIGQMFSKGKENPEKYYHPNKDAFTDTDNARRRKAGVDDTPLGSYDKGRVKKYTLLKTPKGSTIEFFDGDENEHLSIFDRLGQSFVMHSPATTSYNSGGINTRGLFNVIKQKFNKTIELTAIILLKTLTGSFLRMTSTSSGATTDLVTVYNNTEVGFHVDIGSDNRILIFYKDSKIELTDNNVNIQSSSTINLNASTINLSASQINASTNIQIGGASSPSISNYTNTNDEQAIKE